MLNHMRQANNQAMMHDMKETMQLQECTKSKRKTARSSGRRGIGGPAGNAHWQPGLFQRNTDHAAGVTAMPDRHNDAGWSESGVGQADLFFSPNTIKT